MLIFLFLIEILYTRMSKPPVYRPIPTRQDCGNFIKLDDLSRLIDYLKPHYANKTFTKIQC